jgi:predicted metalloprotease with PDZ domain
MKSGTKIVAPLVVMLVAVGASAYGQEREHREGRHQEHLEACGEQEVAVGALGIKALACGPCTQSSKDGRWIWSFDAEPVVLEVQEGGPADGKLEPDDRIVSIEGHLITSAEGGDRWSMVGPDETVTLVVRRDGRERTVEIQAGQECEKREHAISIPEDVDVVIQNPEHPEQRHHVRLIRLLPEGWFGLAFSCRCTVHVDAEAKVWDFEEPPEVTAVAEDGPAWQAGLRAGDIITAVDGFPVTEEEGAARLTRVRPGETLRLTVERDGSSRTVEITAAERPIRD